MIELGKDKSCWRVKSVFFQNCKLIVCTFLEALGDMSCVTLGNTNNQECGRPRGFRLSQRYLASTIYTPSKDVIRSFGLNKEGKLII